jgi:hypothetical protein
VSTTLDLLTTVGTCLGCGIRQALCTYGQCPRCHTSGRPRTRGRLDTVSQQPVPLCCGWWGWRETTPWVCLTCGTLVRGQGETTPARLMPGP